MHADFWVPLTCHCSSFVFAIVTWGLVVELIDCLDLQDLDEMSLRLPFVDANLFRHGLKIDFMYTLGEVEFLVFFFVSCVLRHFVQRM